MKKIILFGLVCCILVAPVMAGDMSLLYKAPVYTKAPSVIAYDWSGLYVGGNFGGSWGAHHLTTTQFAPPPFLAVDVAALSSAESPSMNSRSFTGGLHVGYNRQIAHVVWGIEADIDYLGLNGSNDEIFPFPSTLPEGATGPPTQFFSTATSASTNWLFTARPRLGFAAANWLLYVTGGLAVGDEKFSQTVMLLAPFVENANFSTNRVGWIPVPLAPQQIHHPIQLLIPAVLALQRIHPPIQ